MESKPTTPFAEDGLLWTEHPSSDKKPVVSVVMSVLDGGPYLRESVESILHQTFENFEFLITDDGSKDDTWSILKSYQEQDQRIRLFRNEYNLGLTMSLNRAIAQAKGQYIARMDADDVSLPERFALQVEYLEQHQHVGVLGTAYYRLFSNGKKVLRRPPSSDTGVRWQLLFDNVWCHGSVMFRTSLLESQKAYEDIVYSQDYELWVRLTKRTHCATLPVPLVIYRTHGNQGISAVHHEEQKRLAKSISAQQIQSLFSTDTISSRQIDGARRCYRGRGITPQDLPSAFLVLEIFKSFERQSGISRTITRDIRRQWIRRFLSGLGPHLWGNIWKSGLLKSFAAQDSYAVFTVLSIDLPKRFFMNLKRLLRRN